LLYIDFRYILASEASNHHFSCLETRKTMQKEIQENSRHILLHMSQKHYVSGSQNQVLSHSLSTVCFVHFQFELVY